MRTGALSLYVSGLLGTVLSLSLAGEPESQACADAKLQQAETLIVEASYSPDSRTSNVKYAAAAEVYRLAAETCAASGAIGDALRLFTNSIQLLLRADMTEVANEVIASARAVLARTGLTGEAGVRFRILAPITAAAIDAHDQRSASYFLSQLDDAVSACGPSERSWLHGLRARLNRLLARPELAERELRLAIYYAQQAPAAAPLYRWQWELSELQAKNAISDNAVENAVAAFRSASQIYDALVARDLSAHIPFRDGTGRLYLHAIDLLLRRAQRNSSTKTSDLHTATEILESLRRGEITSWFGHACNLPQDFRRTGLQERDKLAAIVYPVFLRDRVEIIVAAGGKFDSYAVKASPEELRALLGSLRELLEKRTTIEYLKPAQRAWKLIMEPLQEIIAGQGIRTLVFVPDGAFHRVPVAAFHDGRRFLIEQYEVAVSPGLPIPNGLELPEGNVDRRRMAVLAATVSQSVGSYPELPQVTKETDTIRSVFAHADLLSDKRFRLSTLQGQIQKTEYQILHIASHADFRPSAGSSVLVTAKETVGVEELNGILGRFRGFSKLNLIVFSACETARGDDRAALGLAGLAVQSGAASALATLWHVNDIAAAEITGNFYRELVKSGVRKSRALQMAQTRMLGDPWYSHPGYWAPFVLIHDWR